MARLMRDEAGTTVFVFTAATLVLRLGGNIVLTRLLDPGAFGVVGIIVSIMVTLTMMSDLGFLDFVVRHQRGGDRRLLDVLWTIRLGQSGLLSLAMLLAAWPVALFLEKPELAPPIAAMAPLFLVNALCPMTLLLAQREGRVRAVCLIELGALAVQVAFNLALSLAMPDYRALLVGLYVGAIVRMLLTLRMIEGGSRLAWDRGSAAELMGFSRWVLPSSLLTLLLTQSDKFLFARLFSMAGFGAYILPSNLALAAQPFGRNYVERYFFPLVSRAWREGPDRLAAVFYAARQRQFLLLFAGIGFGMGAAPALFGILFDHRYEYGWIYFTVLLLRVGFDLDSFANIQTVVAMGRSSPILHANLLRFGLFLLWIAAFFRPLGALALPLALTVAELGALLYSIALLRRQGLFRLRQHGLYYAALVAALAPGAALSWLFARNVVAAGLAAIG
ncbi:oligosaccharide flippase family protein [Sphingomonas sp. YL-JM2C]